MRLLAVAGLVVLLVACGTSPKDYSDAAKLTPIDSRLAVQLHWLAPTGDRPDFAHAQLPPAVSADGVYYANARGEVVALAANNGETRWQVGLDDAITGGPGAGAGKVVVATREAQIIALSQQDGSELWRSRVSSEVLAKPLVDDDLVIVQTIDGKIAALATDSGKRVWSYSRNTPALTLRGTSVPLRLGDRILAGFADGKLVSLNRSTGELQWEVSIGVPTGRTDLERLVDIDGLFQANSDTVYVSSYQGRIAAIAVRNGETLWAREMSSFTGLTVSGGQVFITDAESHVWALDGRTGATLWRQDNLLGRELSTPAVQGDAVVVADYDGFVHWLSKEDGQFVARRDLGKLWQRSRFVWYDDEEEELPHRSISVAPLVTADSLIVRDNIGALAVFRLAPAANP
jgi:outer membrane protein assembly factor BamB